MIVTSAVPMHCFEFVVFVRFKGDPIALEFTFLVIKNWRAIVVSETCVRKHLCDFNK